MRIKDILNVAYSPKSNGDMSKYALNLATKNNLNIEQEINSKDSSLDILILLPKKRQIIVLEYIRKEFEEKPQIREDKKEEFRLSYLKTKSYKQVAKMLHPDNKDVGNEEDFKFLQEIKSKFWGEAEFSTIDIYKKDFESKELQEYKRIYSMMKKKYPHLNKRDLEIKALSEYLKYA
ncbi:MAG: hypothetical protein ACRDDY_03660 [Clostridium sp.]|uniref:hypothetical protein n=1 Tax=Clostridium sp. TaxID=1506 RepID=UPI003EE7515C